VGPGGAKRGRARRGVARRSAHDCAGGASAAFPSAGRTSGLQVSASAVSGTGRAISGGTSNSFHSACCLDETGAAVDSAVPSVAMLSDSARSDASSTACSASSSSSIRSGLGSGAVPSFWAGGGEQASINVRPVGEWDLARLAERGSLLNDGRAVQCT